jgi:hypothetical protein
MPPTKTQAKPFYERPPITSGGGMLPPPTKAGALHVMHPSEATSITSTWLCNRTTPIASHRESCAIVSRELYLARPIAAPLVEGSLEEWREVLGVRRGGHVRLLIVVAIEGHGQEDLRQGRTVMRHMPRMTRHYSKKVHGNMGRAVGPATLVASHLLVGLDSEAPDGGVGVCILIKDMKDSHDKYEMSLPLSSTDSRTLRLLTFW